MALEVEDGTGKPDADSYLSVTDASTLIGERHGTAAKATWDALADNVKEAALREATLYVDGTYGPRFIGYRRFGLQALEWPRVDAAVGDAYDGAWIPWDSVPDKVLLATAMLAYKARSGPLSVDSSDARVTQSESVEVGPISISTSYESGSSTTDRFREVTTVLRSLTGSSVNVPVVLA